MVDSITAIKRLMSPGNQVININQMILPNVRSHNSDFTQASGVMRYKLNKEFKISFPRYKYLILMNNHIYTYNKFHIYEKMDMMVNLHSIIEFNNDEEARITWEKYVNNPIVTR